MPHVAPVTGPLCPGCLHPDHNDRRCSVVVELPVWGHCPCTRALAHKKTAAGVANR